MNRNEIISRIKANLALKIVFSVVFTIGFPAIYFGVLQRYQVFPVTTMQNSSLDQWIPLFPGSVYLYESIFLLMPIAPWLADAKAELYAYCLGFTFMSLVGFCIFFFFPTVTSRPQDIYGANALYTALMKFDNGMNACPSFHSAFSVFHGILCHRTFRTESRTGWMRPVIWIWVAGIIASALLTKQHVFLDIVTGALLGVGGIAVFYLSRNGLSQRKERFCE